MVSGEKALASWEAGCIGGMVTLLTKGHMQTSPPTKPEGIWAPTAARQIRKNLYSQLTTMAGKSSLIILRNNFNHPNQKTTTANFCVRQLDVYGPKIAWTYS